MTAIPRRLARIRPLTSATADEQFFASNDAAGFNSAEGRIWTLIDSPFPGSRANSSSPARPGWEPGTQVGEDDFQFLAPSAPANVLGMAHNTGQAGRDLPPQAFHKAAGSVIGPGEAIEIAPGMTRVDPEAELAVVIGKTARGLTLDTAREAVLGFTVSNDVTCRDLQKTDELWISAKSQDTFTPAGPWIVTGLDEADLAVDVAVNGTQLRPASTADLGWKVDEILVYLTSFMTLYPGDLVLTGFPAETAPLAPGDTVVCRVEGVGELANPVRESPWSGVPGQVKPGRCGRLGGWTQPSRLRPWPSSPRPWQSRRRHRRGLPGPAACCGIRQPGSCCASQALAWCAPRLPWPPTRCCARGWTPSWPMQRH